MKYISKILIIIGFVPILWAISSISVWILISMAIWISVAKLPPYFNPRKNPPKDEKNFPYFD